MQVGLGRSGSWGPETLKFGRDGQPKQPNFPPNKGLKNRGTSPAWKQWLMAATLAVAGVSPLGVSWAEEPPAKPVPKHAHTHPGMASQISLEAVDAALRGKGLSGHMHAADGENGLLVFTYRNPENFFDNLQLSLKAATPEVAEQLAQLNRHDAVRLTGSIVNLENPQPHIRVASVEVLKAWALMEDIPTDTHRKTTPLPEALKGKTEAPFLVHAVVDQGRVLVLEYRDQLVMMVAPDNTWTKDLFRGDRVTVRYSVRNWPKAPTHIELNTDTTEGKIPLQVVESLEALHEKKHTQQGRLVLFKQSPQINRDIWAVEQLLPDGTARYMTLVNFTDEDGGQGAIDAKLKTWWSTHPDKVRDGRNKLLKEGLRIQVEGTLNVVSPNQANAQLFTTADQLTLLPGEES